MRTTWAMLWVVAVAGGAPVSGKDAFRADAAIECTQCAAWNQDQAPFRVFGATYYVGVRGLSSVLIAGDDGLILLDGGLPQSAPLVAEHLRTLGFRVEDVKLIVNSHAHYDHAGGIAALQRASGARVAASPAGARALELGRPVAEDPQYTGDDGFGGFPRVAKVAVVADGETLRVGSLRITAHLTPGHTPGSTTWTWRSCEAERCLDMVYADSLNAVSVDGFRYTGEGKRGDRTPEFRRSIEAVGALPCDVLLTVHPEFARTLDKAAERVAGKADAFVDPQACRAYADGAMQRLGQRIIDEQSAADADQRHSPRATNAAQ